MPAEKSVLVETIDVESVGWSGSIPSSMPEPSTSNGPGLSRPDLTLPGVPDTILLELGVEIRCALPGCGHGMSSTRGKRDPSKR